MNKDTVLTEIASLLNDPLVKSELSPILARVEKALAATSLEPQSWEPVPLDVFGAALPNSIKSCWVFIFRAGAKFGAERHPNSHQRTIALRGGAVFEVLEDNTWLPCPIGDSGGAESSSQSVSIPAGTWHRIGIGPENFVSVSFHTTSAQELIEETPVNDDLSVTRKRLYHA
ncbi:MAG: hypothetical protein ACREA2_24035 [Blastocatellia bacterium]